MCSDSETLQDLPSDEALEAALVNAVRNAQRKGELEEITVNKARAAAEEELALRDGFFKGDSEWKAKSKEIIGLAVDKCQTGEPSPVSKPARLASPTTQAFKRKSVTKSTTSRKRQKHGAQEDESEERKSPQTRRQPEDAQRQRGGKKNRRSVAEESEDERHSKSREAPAAAPPAHENGDQEDESELSDVIDEVQPKKKRSKGEVKARPKSVAKPASVKVDKATTAQAPDLDPDEAEIKRLQSWLLKCGIRKLWHKELAPYDSFKAKIRHLKDMLKNAGMDGRYSAEKAKAIKEQRELAADLEAVQEGAKKWGHEDDSDSDNAGRRRKGPAANFVDFGDDGEDSD